MADGFESGTRSAAAGGNTTVLPFALQPRGQSLRQSVEDYHAKARGKSYVDYGFHLIVTDPTPAVLGQELPALVERGLSLVQGLHDLRRSRVDRPAIAGGVHGRARKRGLIMVHAEGYDQIKFMTDRLEREGNTHPTTTPIRGPSGRREATHRAIAMPN